MPFGSGVHIPSCALLARSTGHRAGGCTGTNLWGAFAIIAELRASGVRGSVVTLLCDGGERYSRTYYDDGWLRAQDMDPEPYQGALNSFLSQASWLNANPSTVLPARHGSPAWPRGETAA